MFETVNDETLSVSVNYRFNLAIKSLHSTRLEQLFISRNFTAIILLHNPLKISLKYHSRVALCAIYIPQYKENRFAKSCLYLM